MFTRKELLAIERAKLLDEETGRRAVGAALTRQIKHGQNLLGNMDGPLFWDGDDSSQKPLFDEREQ